MPWYGNGACWDTLVHHLESKERRLCSSELGLLPFKFMPNKLNKTRDDSIHQGFFNSPLKWHLGKVIKLIEPGVHNSMCRKKYNFSGPDYTVVELA